MRIALTAFESCFPKNRAAAWRKECKKLARALNPIRDADVQIAFLAKYREEITDERRQRTVDLLLAERRAHRASMQDTLIASVDALHASNVLKDMSATCSKQLKHEAWASISPGVHARAHAYIAEQIDDVYAHEFCLDRENAVREQHAMRIRIKHLRYALELFDTLVDDGFSNEIAMLKGLQDSLGALRDYDVLMEAIPDRIARSSVKARETNDILQGTLGILDDFGRRRMLLFAEVAECWKKARTDGTFTRLDAFREPILTLPVKLFPRIALISDIHGNRDALRAVIYDAKKRGVSLFLNAGDSVGYGPHSDAVIKDLQNEQFISVIGNYDVKVLEARQNRDGDTAADDEGRVLHFAARDIGDERAGILAAFPPEQRIRLGTTAVLITHGSPECLVESLSDAMDTEQQERYAARAGADIVITGHTHRQRSDTVGTTRFLNPGSVGRPDDGDNRAAYMLLDTATMHVESIRLPYDVDRAAGALRRKKQPELLAQMLLAGVSLDAAQDDELDREEAVKTNTHENERAAVRACAARYVRNLHHEEQVGALACALFDHMAGLHGLGPRARQLLEYAALLHDIGWSRGAKGHHKSSHMLIMNDRALPFTTRERGIVGAVARYHRKALPSPSHDHFMALTEDDRHTVRVLASFLRLADGLDASHGAGVDVLNVTQSPKSVVVECSARGSSYLEREAWNTKKKLFEKTFGMPIELTWAP